MGKLSPTSSWLGSNECTSKGRHAGPRGYAEPRESGSRKGASEVIGLSRFSSNSLIFPSYSQATVLTRCGSRRVASSGCTGGT